MIIHNLTQFWGQHSKTISLDMQFLKLGELTNFFRQWYQVIVSKTQLRANIKSVRTIFSYHKAAPKRALLPLPPTFSWMLNSPNLFTSVFW